LNALFREIDKDGSGCIDEEEWRDLCQDTALFNELSVATAYNEKDLKDLFKCLSASKARIDDVTGVVSSGMNIMYFDDLLEHLRVTADPADKRCVLQVMARLQFMEQKLEKQMQDMWDAFIAGSPGALLMPRPFLAEPQAVGSSGRARTPLASPADTPRSRKNKSQVVPASSPLLGKAKAQESPAGSARTFRRPSDARSAKPANGYGLHEAITKL